MATPTIDCTKCRRTKPLGSFNSWCKECIKASTDRWRRTSQGMSAGRQRVARFRDRLRKDDPDRLRRMQRDSELYKRYGMRVADFDSISAEQNDCCAICEQRQEGKRLHVDHDHDSGAVRGLLCSGCNVGLGSFRDNPDLMARAIAYLKIHSIAPAMQLET